MTDKPTPLAILLEAMHRKWADGDHDGAVVLARVAAPYLHPRVTAARSATELRLVPDAELDTICGGDGADASSDAAHEPG